MHGAHVHHFVTLKNVLPRSLLLEIVLLACSLLFWSKNQGSWCKGEAFTSTGICLSRFVRIWLRAAVSFSSSWRREASFFGTYPVFFQEQPGNVDVPVLESVHEGSDSTIVPAVRLVPAPGREGKSEGRISSGSKTHPGPGASRWRGSRAPEKDKKPPQRPRINLSRCFTARGTGLLGIWGSETWYSAAAARSGSVDHLHFPEQMVLGGARCAQTSRWQRGKPHKAVPRTQKKIKIKACRSHRGYGSAEMGKE